MRSVLPLASVVAKTELGCSNHLQPVIIPNPALIPFQENASSKEMIVHQVMLRQDGKEANYL